MNRLTITYEGADYVLHYAGTQVYYLRTADGSILDYDDIEPRLLALCEQAIAHEH
jgi:hypothetical protein